MTLDPADLKLRIEEAFGGMPYPGDEHIVYGCCWECEDIKSALKGLHWRDVSFEILDNLRAALPFLVPEGFRFYLPAYMIISIMDFNRADVISDSVINQLTPLYALDIDRMSEQIASWPRVGPFSSIDWEPIIEKIADYQ